MMPELAKSDAFLAQPNRAETPSEADMATNVAINVPSDRPPPPSQHPPSIHPPPASIPTSNSGMAAPNFGVAGPYSRRTVAITAAMLGGAAVILLLVAALSRSDEEPHAAAATRGTVVSAVSGGVAAPKIAAPPAATSSSDVPVISVDSLPVATRNAPTQKGNGNGRLAIVASPGNCSVSVDGVARGTTPLGGLELPAGPHRIDCAPPSGKSKTVSVTISEGASARYKFSLDD